jgi:hypothetical protein
MTGMVGLRRGRLAPLPLLPEILAARSTWNIASCNLKEISTLSSSWMEDWTREPGDQIRHVRLSSMETGNLRSKLVGGGTERIVREMSAKTNPFPCVRIASTKPKGLNLERLSPLFDWWSQPGSNR